MYRDIVEYISKQSENAEYGDAFVQKLADFFAANYPDLKALTVVDRDLFCCQILCQFFEFIQTAKVVICNGLSVPAADFKEKSIPTEHPPEKRADYVCV